MVERKGAAGDRLSGLGAFTLALVGTIATAYASESWLTLANGMPVIWFVPGIAVGVIVAVSAIKTQASAFTGGVAGFSIYLSDVGHDESPFLYLGSYVTEVALTSFGVLVVFKARLPQAVGGARALFALTWCIVAAGLSTLPLMAAGPATLQAFVSFALSHATGTYAISSVVVLSRIGWLLINPWTHPYRLVGAVLAIAFIGALIFVEHNLLYVSFGLCLVVTSRYGTRIGQPAALFFVLLAGIAATHGLGNFPEIEADGLIEIHAFALSITVLTTVAGRYAFQADGKVREEQASTARWQKLTNTAFDGYIEIGRDYTVEDASERVGILLGIQTRDILGLPFQALFDDDRWATVAHFAEMVLAGQTVRFDRSFTNPIGETRWALTLVEPKIAKNGEFDGCTVFLRDTTPTHRVNAERTKSRSEVKEAQQAERRRLAQLVHNGALQDLAAANLLIGAARLGADRLSADGQDPALPELDNFERIEELLVSGMQKLRTDAIGSMDIEYLDADVVGALEQTVAKFASVTSAEIRITENDVGQAAPEQCRVIFQIAREALVNAILHSGAALITVDLRKTRDGYSIAIVDDGNGFDSTQLQEVGHLGLGMMTAFAHEVGGWCSLSTRPHRGTSIQAWIPNPLLTHDDVIDLRDSNVAKPAREPTGSEFQRLW